MELKHGNHNGEVVKENNLQSNLKSFLLNWKIVKIELRNQFYKLFFQEDTLIA